MINKKFEILKVKTPTKNRLYGLKAENPRCTFDEIINNLLDKNERPKKKERSIFGRI